jgi:hypothetical protein
VKAEHIKLLKSMPETDWTTALNQDGSFKPEYMAECCRIAIYNWTIRLLAEDGKDCPMPYNGWRNNFDALKAWRDALDYWEAKAKEADETRFTG